MINNIPNDNEMSTALINAITQMMDMLVILTAQLASMRDTQEDSCSKIVAAIQILAQWIPQTRDTTTDNGSGTVLHTMAQDHAANPMYYCNRRTSCHPPG